MINLNLEAKNSSQRRIKEYLEQNVSELLADKINNGVAITKDDKTVINKKDLDGFWKYASSLARKDNTEYVDDDTVFGWAIHYFEQEDIEGTLYNEDGTKYELPKPIFIPPTSPVTAKPTPPKAQLSFFDNTSSVIEKDTGLVIMQQKDITVKQPSSFYKKYTTFQQQYPQAVIAYRLGDFFEVLGDYAVTIANELNLTLTGRDCSLAERVPMIGFPYHASDVYFNKIALNHNLVIVENDVAMPHIKTTPTQNNDSDALQVLLNILGKDIIYIYDEEDVI